MAPQGLSNLKERMSRFKSGSPTLSPCVEFSVVTTTAWAAQIARGVIHSVGAAPSLRLRTQLGM